MFLVEVVNITKYKKKVMDVIDLESKLTNIELDFSSESENNTDLGLAIGMLFSLNEFSKTTRIRKRMLKSMTFLELTNKIQKENMEKFRLNSIEVKGKSRKEFKSIIETLARNQGKREVQHESRLNRLLRR